MTKKVSEMTLAEFLDEVNKKDPNNIVDDKELGLLAVLKREGFTEEEALNMNMEKVWKFYMDSLTEFSSKLFTNLFKTMEAHPENAGLVKPLLDDMVQQMKDLEKEYVTDKKTDKKHE